MNGTILNITMAIVSLGLIVFVAKKEKLSYKHDLGIVMPNWKNIIFWTSLFVFLMFCEDYLFNLYAGNTIVETWKGKYTIPQMIFRGIGIVIIAPIAEELIFRGLLYWRIKNSRLKTIGAIIIPALLFAGIHIQYSELLTLGIIFFDGVFYGLARHFSKSVMLAFFLHSLSNLGAVIERII